MTSLDIKKYVASVVFVLLEDPNDCKYRNCRFIMMYRTSSCAQHPCMVYLPTFTINLNQM